MFTAFLKSWIKYKHLRKYFDKCQYFQVLFRATFQQIIIIIAQWLWFWGPPFATV